MMHEPGDRRAMRNARASSRYQQNRVLRGRFHLTPDQLPPQGLQGIAVRQPEKKVAAVRDPSSASVRGPNRSEQSHTGRRTRLGLRLIDRKRQHRGNIVAQWRHRYGRAATAGSARPRSHIRAGARQHSTTPGGTASRIVPRRPKTVSSLWKKRSPRAAQSESPAPSIGATQISGMGVGTVVGSTSSVAAQSVNTYLRSLWTKPPTNGIAASEVDLPTQMGWVAKTSPSTLSKEAVATIPVSAHHRILREHLLDYGRHLHRAYMQNMKEQCATRDAKNRGLHSRLRATKEAFRACYKEMIKHKEYAQHLMNGGQLSTSQVLDEKQESLPSIATVPLPSPTISTPVSRWVA